MWLCGMGGAAAATAVSAAVAVAAVLAALMCFWPLAAAWLLCGFGQLQACLPAYLPLSRFRCGRDQHQESLPPMIKLTPPSSLDAQIKVGGRVGTLCVWRGDRWVGGSVPLRAHLIVRSQAGCWRCSWRAARAGQGELRHAACLDADHMPQHDICGCCMFVAGCCQCTTLSLLAGSG